jgi:hypothetical protein
MELSCSCNSEFRDGIPYITAGKDWNITITFIRGEFYDFEKLQIMIYSTSDIEDLINTFVDSYSNINRAKKIMMMKKLSSVSDIGCYVEFYSCYENNYLNSVGEIVHETSLNTILVSILKKIIK